MPQGHKGRFAQETGELKQSRAGKEEGKQWEEQEEVWRRGNAMN